MSLPFFYVENAVAIDNLLTLNEDTSKHVVSVLRMSIGDELHITNGKGLLLTAEIITDHKKKCEVKITNTHFAPPASVINSIAVSLLKNATRFEWFLEKATELGITEIIPLICERTEREHFRYERMQGVLISAMLQSQQCWLPVLQQPQKLMELITQTTYEQKLIAHCVDNEKLKLTDMVKLNLPSRIILIGPEGDFTSAEIEFALQLHFTPITLGSTRLRTETAAMAAAVIFKIGN